VAETRLRQDRQARQIPHAISPVVPHRGKTSVTLHTLHKRITTLKHSRVNPLYATFQGRVDPAIQLRTITVHPRNNTT
jgi:hypothetical protein